MATLPDGTEIDMPREPRLLKHNDELYVVGKGWLVPIKEEEEFEKVKERILSDRSCMLEP